MKIIKIYSYVYEGKLWILELLNGEWIDRKTYFTAIKQRA